MSIRVMAAVWSGFPGSGSELLTMLALADYADDHGGRVYPSMDGLGKKVRLTTKQVRRVVHKLTADNWLVLVKVSRGRTTRHYSINLARLNTPTDGRVNTPVHGRVNAPTDGRVGDISTLPPARLNPPTGASQPSHRREPIRHDPPRTKEKRPVVVEIPDVLNTDEFMESWAAWKQHRIEIKKRLTPTTEQRQLKKLANMGRKRAVAALEHSMANGWLGIFESKEVATDLDDECKDIPDELVVDSSHDFDFLKPPPPAPPPPPRRIPLPPPPPPAAPRTQEATHA